MDKFKRWVWIGLAVALAAAVGALFWPRQGDEAVPPRIILPGHPTYVQSLAFFSDSKTLLSAGNDNVVRLWDAETGKLLNTGIAPGAFASISPDEQRIAVWNPRKEIYLWNISTGESTMLEASRGGIAAITFAPDGRTVSATNSYKSIAVWDVETGALLHTVDGFAFTYSPDSKRIVTNNPASAPKVWDIETGALLHTLGAHSSWSHPSYSPDGKRIVTASYEGGIQVWDAKTGALVHMLHGHRGEMLMPAYYPDGKTITSVMERNVKIWNADTGALIKTLNEKMAGNRHIYGNPYSPTGDKYLIQKIPSAVRIWDATSGELLRTLSHSSRRFNRFTYSPDGKTIAGANENGEIYIWHIEQTASAP
ncbi:MAG: WD40 repeat domain-containing protein [Candidatus Poribacteria bacterium]|nr:WD40 repeat domain-containing protein [Candidatus Poribacteria bacterium]